MEVEFIKISCARELLGLFLEGLEGQAYVLIEEADSPETCYFGFIDRQDLLLIRRFAKVGGITFHEISEAQMKFIPFEPSRVKISGDRELLSWM